MQGEQDPSRAEGGLGLGLSLVQQLVTLHGGDVAAYSAGEGKGSEFVVRIPLIDTPEEAPEREATQGTVHAQRMLVVDDNRDAADTMAALLEVMGYRARTAYDARGALEAIRADRPDVAFLDIGLPDMDGIALAKAIGEEFGDAIHLIAVTGYGQENHRGATRAAGFSDHLVKPLTPDALSGALERIPAAPRA